MRKVSKNSISTTERNLRLITSDTIFLILFIRVTNVKLLKGSGKKLTKI
jgi:hypothetical protein